MNTTRVMQAARKHFKLTNGACGCSVCMEIRKPYICPDLEELLSYNKTASAKVQKTTKANSVHSREFACQSGNKSPTTVYMPPRPP